jgi:hypothetical protein
VNNADPYPRYLVVNVNGTEALRTVVVGGESGSVDIAQYLINGSNSIAITITTYVGSWICDATLDYSATAGGGGGVTVSGVYIPPTPSGGILDKIKAVIQEHPMVVAGAVIGVVGVAGAGLYLSKRKKR